jgi:hypothetical protein
MSLQKFLLKDQSAYIKKISKNYYLIKRMTVFFLWQKCLPIRKQIFSINILLKSRQRRKEELERKRAERSKGFDTGDYNATSIFANSSNSFEDFGVATKGFISAIPEPFLKEHRPLNRPGETELL